MGDIKDIPVIPCLFNGYNVYANGNTITGKETRENKYGEHNKGFDITNEDIRNKELSKQSVDTKVDDPSETENWWTKGKGKKRTNDVQLVKYGKIKGDVPVAKDAENVSDECAPTSVTSSSSALQISVSSGDSITKQDGSQCKECGTQRQDSGYHGQYDKDKVRWINSSSSASNSTGIDEHAWRFPLEQFTSKRQGSKRKHRSVPRPLRSFYKSQDKLINQFEDVRLDLDDAMDNAEDMKKLRKTASLFAKWTFIINFCLLIIKIVAVIMSGSISLISSLVDSSVDLLSGLVIWITTRMVKRTDRYDYPQGRTKLEPMAIVILSVIMSAASLQIVKESVTKIIGLSDGSESIPHMDFITIGISGTTVIAKLILFLLCRRIPHPTVQALSQDHKNDVLFNSAAIVFGYIGSTQMQKLSQIPALIYCDPAGALLLCIYIIASWCMTGWEQIKLLIGHTASPEFLSKVTWMAVDHHKKIQKVDTVRAFHFGNQFLVEVDIVLPPEMTLQEAHDISEPLQQRIERLPDVERAFVHVDYETTHDPDSEHKRL